LSLSVNTSYIHVNLDALTFDLSYYYPILLQWHKD